MMREELAMMREELAMVHAVRETRGASHVLGGASHFACSCVTACSLTQTSPLLPLVL